MLKPIEIQDRVIVALDMPYENVPHFVTILGDSVRCYKVGFELFLEAGERVIAYLAEAKKSVFLDLKLHDIPNTVMRALQNIVSYPTVLFTTVHALGGRKMLEAVHRITADSAVIPLAVTVLTSHSNAEWQEICGTSIEKSVLTLANMAYDAGIRGFVCSAFEASMIKERLHSDCITVCPGIRMPQDAVGDQARVMTPMQALTAGADYIVMGRSISSSEDPLGVVRQVYASLSSKVL